MGKCGEIWGDVGRYELALLDQLLHHRRKAVDLFTAAGVNSVSSQCCMASVRPVAESDGYARPRMPSNFERTKAAPGSVTA